MNTAWTVFRKELKDALRDRRTWLIVLVTSILAGPLTLLLLSIARWLGVRPAGTYFTRSKRPPAWSAAACQR
jgi:ABC-type transport system involved in multi-copper enzyme maturation permease subunit